MKNSTYDFIIIGAGVVGSMIARWLSRYQADILLIDKEADIGMGATAANSAIVHPGYDPQPGSLKALTNVRANPMWDQLSAELNFAFQRPGDFVVAIGEQELPILDTLYQQGVKNGVPGMKIISAAEMLEREPLINPEVSGALWASTGGICDPFQVTVAAAENAVLNGAEVLLETEFLDFLMEGSRVVGVRTNRGDFFAAGSSTLLAFMPMRSCTKPESVRNLSSSRGGVNISSLTVPTFAPETFTSPSRRKRERASW